MHIAPQTGYPRRSAGRSGCPTATAGAISAGSPQPETRDSPRGRPDVQARPRTGPGRAVASLRLAPPAEPSQAGAEFGRRPTRSRVGAGDGAGHV